MELTTYFSVEIKLRIPVSCHHEQGNKVIARLNTTELSPDYARLQGEATTEQEAVRQLQEKIQHITSKGRYDG